MLILEGMNFKEVRMNGGSGIIPLDCYMKLIWERAFHFVKEYSIYLKFKQHLFLTPNIIC